MFTGIHVCRPSGGYWPHHVTNLPTASRGDSSIMRANVNLMWWQLWWRNAAYSYKWSFLRDHSSQTTSLCIRFQLRSGWIAVFPAHAHCFPPSFVSIQSNHKLNQTVLWHNLESRWTICAWATTELNVGLLYWIALVLFIVYIHHTSTASYLSVSTEKKTCTSCTGKSHFLE